MNKKLEESRKIEAENPKNPRDLPQREVLRARALPRAAEVVRAQEVRLVARLVGRRPRRLRVRDEPRERVLSGERGYCISSFFFMNFPSRQSGNCSASQSGTNQGEEVS